MEDAVYLSDYVINSFEEDKKIVYIHIKRIDEEIFSDQDEMKFLDFLKSLGEWERFIELERIKQLDIERKDIEQLIIKHDFYNFTCTKNTHALVRSGRVYQISIYPITPFIEDKYKITNILEFVRESFINLNKWISFKQLNY